MYKVFFGVNIFPSNKKRRRKNRIDFLKVQKVQKMLLPLTDRNTPTWDNGHVVKFEKYFGVFFSKKGNSVIDADEIILVFDL